MSIEDFMFKVVAEHGVETLSLPFETVLWLAAKSEEQSAYADCGEHAENLLRAMSNRSRKAAADREAWVFKMMEGADDA